MELIPKPNREKRITFLITIHILDRLSRLATHYGFIGNGHMVKDICQKCQWTFFRLSAKVIPPVIVRGKGVDNMIEDNNQMLSAISELLDRKLSSELQPIKHDLAGLKQEFGSMKQDMAGLKQEFSDMKQDMAGLKQEFSDMKQEFGGMKQDMAGLKQELCNTKNELREEIRSVENSVLEEIDRVQEIMEKRLDKQDERINVLEQYYKIRKVDDENISLVLNLVVDLKQDVDILKAKIS